MKTLQVPQYSLYGGSPVQLALTGLRNRRTGTSEFRQLAKIVFTSAVEFAAADIDFREFRITTPTGKTTIGVAPAGRIIFVPVMRSGDPMADACASLIPGVCIHHIGLERHHETLKTRCYYQKKPKNPKTVRRCLVLDPMIATGGSAVDALNLVKEWGIICPITFVGIFAAPEGIREINRKHPDVRVCVAAVDKGLNKNGYILPGCGDFGDRYYGTI